MTTSALKSTNDLTSLFSKTLQSLSADAVAVKQISSLHKCMYNNDQDNNRQEEFKEQLRHVQDLVTGLEDKITALRQILSEEKRSIAKFEATLTQEAHEQYSLMEQMLQAFQEHNEQQRHHQVSREASLEQSYQDSSLDPETSMYSDATTVSRTSLPSSSNHLRSRRDSVDPRAKQPTSRAPSSTISTTNRIIGTAGGDVENQDPIQISLPRITPDELDAYKATNARAPRISLLDLNEALVEIEQVVQVQRHAAQVLQLRRRQQEQQQQQNNHVGMTMNAVQRRYEYLEKRHQHVHLEDESSSNAAAAFSSITEQELREKCAFFRHGESTARSTLSLLCRLRRLKQLPAKNQQVIYQLLAVERLPKDNGMAAMV